MLTVGSGLACSVYALFEAGKQYSEFLISKIHTEALQAATPPQEPAVGVELGGVEIVEVGDPP